VSTTAPPTPTAPATDAATAAKTSYEAFYDRMTEVYDPPMTRRHFLEDDRYSNVMAHVAAGPARQRILDVAAGNGWLASLYAPGHEVVGLDIADTNLRRIAGFGIQAIKHNLDEPLPFADASFDTVVASEILEHVFSPDLVLREAWRVLKPGGRVVLTVPNLHALRNRLDLLLGKHTPFIEFRLYDDPNDQLAHVGVQHIRHYTYPGMAGVLRRIGFDQIRWQGQSFHLNGMWPFTLISVLHGGNRGLRVVLRLVSLGRWRPEFPGLELRLRLIKLLARVLPRLAPGMLFVARKPLK
jgi:methionine biosynthesis protein MetW